MNPLMWTVRGNVRVDGLEYEKEWVADGQILWFRERWFFKEDGVLARSNSHGYVYGKRTKLIDRLRKWLRLEDTVTTALGGAAIGSQQE